MQSSHNTLHPALFAVCKHDANGVTCIWAEIKAGEAKVVTITANATTSGTQPSIAAVTTSSMDTDPNNNKAAVEVAVLVSAVLTHKAVCFGCIQAVSCVPSLLPFFSFKRIQPLGHTIHFALI